MREGLTTMNLGVRRQLQKEKLRGLAANNAFAQLGMDKLKKIARLVDQVSAPAGTTLIAEGMPNNTFYLLVDGVVEVSEEGRHRGYIHEGHFFGELGVDDSEPAAVTVTSATWVLLLVATHDKYRAIVALIRGESGRLRGISLIDRLFGIKEAKGLGRRLPPAPSAFESA
jgi:CRP-like cAMP-binding protein